MILLDFRRQNEASQSTDKPYLSGFALEASIIFPLINAPEYFRHYVLIPTCGDLKLSTSLDGIYPHLNWKIKCLREFGIFMEGKFTGRSKIYLKILREKIWLRKYEKPSDCARLDGYSRIVPVC